MNTFQDAVKVVTTDVGGLSLRAAIKHESLEWLLDSAAGKRCLAFSVGDNPENDANLEFERFRAGCLLVILAGMQIGTDEDVLEALRVVAASRVGTRGAPLNERYERAGMARRRPVRDPHHYKRCHLKNVQQCLTDELYDLVTYPDNLERALEENGAVALAKYL